MTLLYSTSWLLDVKYVEIISICSSSCYSKYVENDWLEQISAWISTELFNTRGILKIHDIIIYI